MNDLVVIGIPIYKKELNELEKISLQQVCKILYKYPIVFIASDSLTFDYGIEYQHFKIEKFPEKYFQNTSSYSQLLLSEMFYQRFLKYRFLLIYQLDAFVFSDQLEKFCLMNYDYIGAPMGYVIRKKEWNGWVGNGGFSLRNVKSTIRLLKSTKIFRQENEQLNQIWERFEDQFFAFCGRKNIEDFQTASVEIALSFSFDSDAQKCYRRNNKKLPFGCHAWSKNDIKFYEKFIEQYGYKIREIDKQYGSCDSENRLKMISKYLYQRVLNSIEKKEDIEKKLNGVFGENSVYAIFGSGKEGLSCYRWLKKGKIPIRCFLDNDIKKQGFYIKDLVVKAPHSEFIRRNNIKILIATKMYQKEIIEQVEKMGFVKEKDFIDFAELK